MDDPEKLKSTGFSFIWMEEANEFTYDDYFTLWLRLSEPTMGGERNQIFLSFNPIDENNWIARTLVHEEDVEVIHSTYLDNPFLEDDYIRSLEGIIDKDTNYYRVYVLGEWGSLENLIYPNWDLVDEIPEYNAMCYGVDFGFLVDPTALLKICLVDGEIYLDEMLYEMKLTNSDLIERLTHIEKGDIYGDRDEAQRIEEISRAGWNAYLGEKDVQMGIDLCARHKLHITKRSVNLIKEIRGYMRKKDKDNNVLKDPVKHNDHLMSAMRFGVYGLVSRFGFATSTPSDNRGVIHSFKDIGSRLFGNKPVPRRYEEIVHKFGKGDVREILRG